MNIDTSLLPIPSDVVEVIKEDGNIEDIIDTVLVMDNWDHRMKQFAKQFEPTKDGLKALWEFVSKIPHQEDPFEQQIIRAPAVLWQNKGGDVKDKSLFITAILRCLEIEYVFRFVSFNLDHTPTHMYPVAFLNGEMIIMDPYQKEFNVECKSARIDERSPNNNG